MKPLSKLKQGSRAVIVNFLVDQATNPLFYSRLMQMGLIEGTIIELAHFAPFGGAIAVRCRDTLIALRLSDAELVQVKETE